MSTISFKPNAKKEILDRNKIMDVALTFERRRNFTKRLDEDEVRELRAKLKKRLPLSSREVFHSIKEVDWSVDVEDFLRHMAIIIGLMAGIWFGLLPIVLHEIKAVRETHWRNPFGPVIENVQKAAEYRRTHP